ncbi:dynamin family protein [Acidicapsa dinghuensis]|uniref:Dynamin family protein n=1 Tax=Acidicapsa dinghuensis TaxID=2218256 RepID=A0ABW1ED69_9BACT|nr:dynamin family protein [Acidicapsa dinghuensis]
MDLKGYEQEKFGIADIIRSAQAVDTKDQDLAQECRDLLTRLAEDRFNLLVVGRFSRGKSTLMNAILGGDLLPTGIVPLTSVITTVRYGSRKQVVLHFNGRGLTRDVPLAQLGEYVTQQSNPGNIKNLAYAEIELPVEILRRGFFFVDSPGLGSAIVENTETTERFLPEADAFVLVTSYDSPLSEEEDRILHRIRVTNKRLFVVVNKQDTVREEDRKQAFTFIAERLKRFAFSEAPQIFSLSAREALQAKLATDKSALEASGLQSFEDELLRFLTEERAQAFLANLYSRTGTLLAQWSQRMQKPGLDDPFMPLMERLRALRETDVVPAERQGSSIEGETPKSSVSLQFERRAGCRICGAVLNDIFQFLSKYQYEMTINPEAQREHAVRGGFCPLHTWQYENISSPYGVCTSYPQLVHRIAGELEHIAVSGQDAGSLSSEMKDLLATAKTCKVCEVRVGSERRAIRSAATAAHEVASAGRGGLGACCLPHLAAVTAALGPGEAAQTLLHAHAYLLERTAEDLQRYALRHDALRRYLTSEEERRASEVALLLLAGHRSVNAPWSVDTIL